MKCQKTKPLLFMMPQTSLWCSYLEIRVNCCSGAAAYSHQGAEHICSTSEVRKLTKILQAMSLFDFKREILEDNTAVIKLLHTETLKKKKKYGMSWTLQQGCTLQQHWFALLPVQLAVFDEDSPSERPWLQQRSQMWATSSGGKRKKCKSVVVFNERHSYQRLNCCWVVDGNKSELLTDHSALSQQRSAETVKSCRHSGEGRGSSSEAGQSEPIPVTQNNSHSFW